MQEARGLEVSAMNNNIWTLLAILHHPPLDKRWPGALLSNSNADTFFLNKDVNAGNRIELSFRSGERRRLDPLDHFWVA